MVYKYNDGQAQPVSESIDSQLWYLDDRLSTEESTVPVSFMVEGGWGVFGARARYLQLHRVPRTPGPSLGLSWS